jgi:acyl-ACP thioesterase
MWAFFMFALLMNHHINANRLWDCLKERLLKDNRWIMVGDFNMVENQNDKPSTYGKMILERKRMVWEVLKMVLNIEELEQLKSGFKLM